MRLESSRLAVELDRQPSHRHRCEPAPVKPFLRIARPHNGHLLALEGLFLLMEQINTRSQAPGRINDGNVNHTPTRKTGVSHTLDLRHTFLYLTQNMSHI